MPGTVADVLANGRQFFTFDPADRAADPRRVLRRRLPLRPLAGTRAVQLQPELPRPRSLGQLFQFTAASGSITTLPDIWVIDWRRFLPVNGHDTAPGGMTHTRRIDSTLVPTLFGLPNSGREPAGARQPQPAAGRPEGAAHRPGRRRPDGPAEALPRRPHQPGRTARR